MCYKIYVKIFTQVNAFTYDIWWKGESADMKMHFIMIVFLLVGSFSTPALALEAPKPESIAEKMSFKLVRGVTNIATAIVEIPKQTYLTGRAHGGLGYAVIGPIKGIGMTLYRGFIGMTETAFFMVPQPGYYDPMIDPVFAWQGWDPPPDRLAVGDRQTSSDNKPGE
jgi:putative exosortase-associated protein (TIGR04073 family)